MTSDELRKLADEPWAHVQAHCDGLRAAATEIDRLNAELALYRLNAEIALLKNVADAAMLVFSDTLVGRDSATGKLMKALTALHAFQAKRDEAGK